MAELVVFGAPSFLILAVQYLQSTAPKTLTAVPVSTGAGAPVVHVRDVHSQFVALRGPYSDDDGSGAGVAVGVRLASDA